MDSLSFALGYSLGRPSYLSHPITDAEMRAGLAVIAYGATTFVLCRLAQEVSRPFQRARQRKREREQKLAAIERHKLRCPFLYSDDGTAKDVHEAEAQRQIRK